MCGEQSFPPTWPLSEAGGGAVSKREEGNCSAISVRMPWNYALRKAQRVLHLFHSGTPEGTGQREKQSRPRQAGEGVRSELGAPTCPSVFGSVLMQNQKGAYNESLVKGAPCPRSMQVWG